MTGITSKSTGLNNETTLPILANFAASCGGYPSYYLLGHLHQDLNEDNIISKNDILTHCKSYKPFDGYYKYNDFYLRVWTQIYTFPNSLDDSQAHELIFRMRYNFTFIMQIFSKDNLLIDTVKFRREDAFVPDIKKEFNTVLRMEPYNVSTADINKAETDSLEIDGQFYWSGCLKFEITNIKWNTKILCNSSEDLIQYDLPGAFFLSQSHDDNFRGQTMKGMSIDINCYYFLKTYLSWIDIAPEATMPVLFFIIENWDGTVFDSGQCIIADDQTEGEKEYNAMSIMKHGLLEFKWCQTSYNNERVPFYLREIKYKNTTLGPVYFEKFLYENSKTITKKAEKRFYLFPAVKFALLDDMSDESLYYPLISVTSHGLVPLNPKTVSVQFINAVNNKIYTCVPIDIDDNVRSTYLEGKAYAQDSSGAINFGFSFFGGKILLHCDTWPFDNSDLFNVLVVANEGDEKLCPEEYLSNPYLMSMLPFNKGV